MFESQLTGDSPASLAGAIAMQNPLMVSSCSQKNIHVELHVKSFEYSGGTAVSVGICSVLLSMRETY